MKIITSILGLGIIVLLIYLGIYTTNNSKFVIWFGLITALLAPTAFELFKYSFSSNKIKDLLKITEIEGLMQKATTLDEKVRALKIQQQNLNLIIDLESRKKSLMAEKEIYISLAEKSLREIEKANTSLRVLTKETEVLPDNLKPLYKFIQSQSEMKDSIIIKGKNKIYTIDKKIFGLIPFGEAFYYLFQKINEYITREAD